MDKKEAEERDQDVVGWDFIYSILSCTVTLPCPLFPTTYLRKLVDNITIQNNNNNNNNMASFREANKKSNASVLYNNNNNNNNNSNNFYTIF